MCLMNCHCEAFNYRLTGDGFCFAKGALFNVYKSPSFTGRTFLKLPVTL
ncbi:Receptor protein kinase [Actinidia chinensis var. chinensis]|uniref:Receptor protein kinase n=1 Tax=Actinidia chinensis var. chinensis TaxID=1590841 RepID=A0A2R6RY58_ACTCC|nr:Receptor protein kinase [Actinidia chinensis var. chinensis]